MTAHKKATIALIHKLAIWRRVCATIGVNPARWDIAAVRYSNNVDGIFFRFKGWAK